MTEQFERIGEVLDVAKDCVVQAMPYVEVVEARPYRYHFDSQRWYVEVEVLHWDENEGGAIVLCKVWLDPETKLFKATRITVV